MPADTPPTPGPPSLRSVIVPVVTILVIGILLWAGMKLDPETVAGWKDEAHPLVFFAALVFLPLLGIPMAPFYVLMGATYGVLPSLAAAFTALALNLLICFAVAGWGLGPLLRRLLAKGGYTVPEHSPRRELRFAVMLRLIPAMPNFVKNYVLALSGVSFKVYFISSLLLAFLYALPLIVLGDSVLEQDPLHMAVAAGLLLLLALLAAWCRKKLRVSTTSRVSD